MLGEDTLFERQLKDFQEIENDPNRNVDEREDLLRDQRLYALELLTTTKLNNPQIQRKLQDKFGLDAEESEEVLNFALGEEDGIGESKTNEQGDDLAKVDEDFEKFEGKGIELGDTVQIMDLEGNTTPVPEATVYAMDEALGDDGDMHLTIEVTGSDNEDEQEWYREDQYQIILLKKVGESETDEQEVKEDTKSDLLDIANSKLGWAVAEQLKSILDTPSPEGIEEAELNHNAIRMIYRFLKERPEAEAKNAVEAIEWWVDEGYGDPDIIETKTNEQEEVNEATTSCPRCGGKLDVVNDDVRGEWERIDYYCPKCKRDFSRKIEFDQAGMTTSDEWDDEEGEPVAETKTNEEEIEEENKVDTVSNDPSFERAVEKFAQVESDENKNVDEEEVKEDLYDEPEHQPSVEPAGFLSRSDAQDLCAAWELIGSMDDDPHVRTMADEKAEELHSLISAAQPEGEEENVEVDPSVEYKDPGEYRESKTNEDEVKESYGNVYIKADIEKGLSKEEIIKKIQDRYPDIGDEQAAEIYGGVVSGKGGGWGNNLG